ncbi:MAG: DUF2177 family protein [Hyphomicrobiaceae bacterium]|nr:DUF2177 family protein [Hyphomicrobiaceae bacterium]
MTAIVAYIATLIVFVVVDIIWLGYVANSYYRSQIGHLLAENFNLSAVFAFYLVYAVGIVYFCVMPALASGGAVKALMLGAMFGFFCYATYDLTNLATLKNWSLPMSLIDMAWGALLTGISAAVGAFFAGRLS